MALRKVKIWVNAHASLSTFVYFNQHFFIISVGYWTVINLLMAYEM